jgi:hypothetical protein
MGKILNLWLLRIIFFLADILANYACGIEIYGSIALSIVIAIVLWKQIDNVIYTLFRSYL